jgi:enoyl reductase
VVFDRAGPPEVLRLIPLDVPEPEPGTVVVRVLAAGVNPVDVMVRRGELEDGRPLDRPRTLGNEMAGIVERVGPSVEGLRPGDEVLGFATMACHATHVLVPADQVTAKPPGLPWRVAGSLSSAGQMAHHAVEELSVGPGDTVVVHAAAGGVGTIAAQLARMRGATVIGTASARNHDHLRALGVIPVAYGAGLTERLREQAPGGVDAVIDAAGRGSLDASVPIVRDPGRVATTIDDDAATRLGARRLRPVRRTEVLAELAGQAADGGLRLPIHLAVPLGLAARAHEEVEAGHVRGKVVLLADPRA